jgi:hypothetical protein
VSIPACALDGRNRAPDCTLVDLADGISIGGSAIARQVGGDSIESDAIVRVHPARFRTCLQKTECVQPFSFS